MTTDSTTDEPSAKASSQHGRMRRLPPEFYRGHSFVLWNMAMDERKTGWLNEKTAASFREIQLHAMVRFELMCHVYCLMPDHMHFLWMGLSARSDQSLAATFLRRHMNAILARHGVRFQKQAWDVVLREKDRERQAVTRTAFYVTENAVRAGLVAQAADWSFSGALAVGYPEFDWRDADYVEKTWRIYEMETERLRRAEA